MKTVQNIRDGLRQGTVTVAEFHEFMKAEGQKIDARSADVTWRYGSICDPYDMGYEGEDNIGRVYFARTLGSDVWVEFSDLPHETRRDLRSRLESGKPPLTVPFNPEVERMADAISNVYGDDLFGGPDRARALEAAQAALNAFRDPEHSAG